MTITMGTYINISNIGWKSTLTPPLPTPPKMIKKTRTRHCFILLWWIWWWTGWWYRNHTFLNNIMNTQIVCSYVRNIFLAYFSVRFVVCRIRPRLQPIHTQLQHHLNTMFGNPFSSCWHRCKKCMQTRI